MTRGTRRLYLSGAAVFVAGAAANIVGNLAETRWLLIVGIVGVVAGATLELAALTRYVSGPKPAADDNPPEID